MIPKKIHYVWVGHAEKSPLIQKCIASWKRFCPDYEIIEWGNESLKKIDNQYVREAYSSQKWAFVSDYLRLYALYHEGGFYFDSDLELTDKIDEFLSCKYLTGYEFTAQTLHPLTALMGAEIHNPFVKELLDEYKDIHFIQDDGVMDQTTNVTRVECFMKSKYNLSDKDFTDDPLEFEAGHFVYPSYFFCLPVEGKRNYSVHHFAGSWLDPFRRKNIWEFKSKTSKFRLVRFRKRFSYADDIDYEPNEREIISIPWFNKKHYVLTFKPNKAN